MKPVELEIFLKDGVTPGLKAAGDAVGRFSSETRKHLRDTSEAIKIQRALVNGLEKQCRELEKALKKTAPGLHSVETTAKLGTLRAELAAEKAGLEELTQEQRRIRQEADKAGQSLRQQLRSVREEIATLLLAYRSLTDAEKQTAQGRELARHIDALTEKAGELNDALADTSRAVTNAASDTRGFDQVVGGIQLVVDGFGLATAGAQALGLSQEDLVEVQTRLQAALVASNALTSIRANVQKESALMQGVNAVQARAAAAAETARTWAVGRGVVATKAAAVAQAAFNSVAKANPYVVLAAALVTVIGALYAYSKGCSEAKKAEEKRKAVLEKAKKGQADYRKAVADTAGEQIASFVRLKQSWDALGDSFSKKKKFIADTKDEWKKLGKEIHSVNSMEKLFREHSRDMVNAIILRAELKAYEGRIQSVSEEMGAGIEKNKTFKYTPVKAGDISASGQGMGMFGSTVYQNITPQERAVASGHIRISTSGGVTREVIDEKGAAAVNEMRRAKGNSDALGRQQKARDEAEKTIRDYVVKMQGLSERIEEIMSGIPGVTVDPDSPDTKKNPRVDKERRLADELRKLRQDNEQGEIEQMAEGSERRRRQIALDYDRELAEIDRLRKEFALKNKELGVSGVNSSGLTPEQQDETDRAGRLAVQRRDESLREMYAAEARHMEEYLKEYGTFQQRRLAISSEYDRRIAEAPDRWSRESLEREKSSALQGLEVEAIRQSVDWGSVFGDFGTLFRDQLEPTVEKLRAITRTEEFRNTGLEDKKTLYDLISKLEQAGTSWDNGIFATLGSELTRYQDAMRRYIAAQDEERAATEALAQAKRNLSEAESRGDKNAVFLANMEVTAATGRLAKAGKDVSDFGEAVQDGSSKLQAATTRANNMFTSLASGLAGLQSGSLQGVGGGLMGLDRLFNNSAVTNAVGRELAKGMSKLLGNSAIGNSVAAALGDSGLMGEIISAILSILDILEDGIGTLVSSLVDTVLGAVAGIIGNILDGQMFVQIGASLMDGIAGILDAVTWGGFSSWLDTGNGKEVAATIDRLTERNSALQTAIEDLTDEIKASRGTKSVAAYRDAYRHQGEVNSNYLEMAMAQAGYHGSHHSWNYYWDGFSAEQKDRFSRQIERDWDGSLWDLSPEEMKLLRSNVDMWQQIRDTGKGGYGGRLTELLDDYIDQAGKLEGLTTQLYEGLTGITFDSMYDSFVDRLMDMDMKAEDVAGNVSEYFMRAMLSNKVGELYAGKLEEWWEKFGKAMEDGDLDEAERHALYEEYMEYVNGAVQIRDQLAAATGYDKTGGSGQSGRAGSFSAMSQDQGTKLEGLFASVQGHVANIDTLVEGVAEKMAAAEGYLAKIAESTASAAETLQKIKDLIDTINRDGLRTR